MPEMTKYDHGVPSWVDMGAHDLPAAVRFYTDLLGWETQDMGEEAGHYTIALKNGKRVAALAPAQDPGPPRWTTYVNVDDADAVTKLAEEAGGRVIVPVMDVMGAGRMAIFADTTGAVIAVWQPGDHIGAGLVNEPGTFGWGELTTSDLAKSKAFYSAVFGWEWGGAPEYAEAKVNGRTIAGVMPRPPDIPAEVPDNWLVYFGSVDLDADVAKASSGGATVVVPPTAIPNGGRFAVLTDPEGAAVGLFQA
ncbi:MAG TPA: VOC family protein [Acidimicrobiales bacterium]|jgi:hypothetical protein|nr:VOC family protein [Acidimicrobiales bacterium]